MQGAFSASFRLGLGQTLPESVHLALQRSLQFGRCSRVNDNLGEPAPMVIASEETNRLALPNRFNCHPPEPPEDNSVVGTRSVQ